MRKKHKIIVFYDKVEELKHWGNEYVFRFETRVMGSELKRMRKESRKQTAAALCNSDFYRTLCCNSTGIVRSKRKGTIRFPVFSKSFVALRISKIDAFAMRTAILICEGN